MICKTYSKLDIIRLLSSHCNLPMEEMKTQLIIWRNKWDVALLHILVKAPHTPHPLLIQYFGLFVKPQPPPLHRKARGMWRSRRDLKSGNSMAMRHSLAFCTLGNSRTWRGGSVPYLEIDMPFCWNRVIKIVSIIHILGSSSIVVP